MKATIAHRYGPAEALACEDVEKPTPGDDEVLIRIRAASVNPLDWRFLRGRPYVFRLMFGLRGPKDERCGRDVAVVVEAIGKNVTRFKSGDAVFGVCRGAFAEYGCANEAKIARISNDTAFEQAASTPVAASTALQGLRDHGRIRAGQKVLVNGAAGGVGTFAVQIAKSYGTEVTGVCSTGNIDLVRSIGADRVFDYTHEDFTRDGERYDLIFDAIGNHPLAALRRTLNPGGICLLVGTHSVGRFLMRMPIVALLSRVSDRKLIVFMAKITPEDLAAIGELMESGKVTPVIDRTYSLEWASEALRYAETGHSRGKVILTT
jgi:NADPH:quinone reductase-like Zn-dependent oxidoreductase